MIDPLPALALPDPNNLGPKDPQRDRALVTKYNAAFDALCAAIDTRLSSIDTRLKLVETKAECLNMALAATVGIKPCPDGAATPIGGGSTISSFLLSIPDSELSVGQVETIATELRDSAGNLLTGYTIAWLSSAPSIISVTQDGVVTGNSDGSVVITATSGSKSATIVLTVKTAPLPPPPPPPTPPPVTGSIVVTLFPTSILVGQTSQASAVVKDINGVVIPGAIVTWSGPDNAVASVNQSGLVTGLIVGSGNVYADSGGVTGSAVIVITAPPSPAVVDHVNVTVPASIQVGQQTQGIAVVKDASNNTLTGKVVTWSSSNPSAASVTSTGLITGVAVGTTIITATCESVDGTATLVVNALPSPPPPSALINTISILMGPLKSVPDTIALGGVFAQYESDFVLFDDIQWNAYGSTQDAWAALNYYDRVMIYYVWYARTGLQKYLDRARLLGKNFLDVYAAPNDGQLALIWQMSDGIRLYYEDTHDPRCLHILDRFATNAAYDLTSDPYGYVSCKTDGRILAYYMKGLLHAIQTGAPSTQTPGGVPGGVDYPTTLRLGLNRALNTESRDINGQWRFASCDVSGTLTYTTQPFMNGLLWTMLIRYYEQFEADSRIPAAIKASADITWSENWLVPQQAFQYIAIDCMAYQLTQCLGLGGVFPAPGQTLVYDGGPYPAPDLNQIMVETYQWLAVHYSDPSYATKADEIFAQGVINRAAGNGDGKHFNQQYTTSYRYLGRR